MQICVFHIATACNSSWPAGVKQKLPARLSSGRPIDHESMITTRDSVFSATLTKKDACARRSRRRRRRWSGSCLSATAADRATIGRRGRGERNKRRVGTLHSKLLTGSSWNMRRLSFACGRRRTFSLLQAAGCMSPGTNAGCSPAVFCWLTVGAFLLLLFRWWIAGEINKLDDARIKIEKIVAFYDQNTAKKFQNGFDLDDGLIIYNRVPKTGSTSFVGIAYDLCDKNRFNVLHLNVSKNNHILSLADQARFVQNTTTWLARKPALYHGHIAYLEFSRFGTSKRPIYINIVRDPLDRLVSYYYFLRNGDNFRPHLKRKKAGNTQTFDECVAKEGSDCSADGLWMQIPFFCGHAAECWKAGSEWALEKAKHNLINNYLVVGITDELSDFVAVLETVLPRYFSGASDHYNFGNRSHLRQTFNKMLPSHETVLKIKQSLVWKMEQEFYQFAREQFHFIKQRIFTSKNGHTDAKKQQFVYEKIRPR